MKQTEEDYIPPSEYLKEIINKLAELKAQNEELLARLEKHTNSSTVENQTPAKIAYDFTANRYGIGYSQLDVTFEIKPDGSALVTRTVEIEAFSTLSKLDTYLLIPDQAADGSEREIEPLKLESLSPNHHTITIQKATESEKDQVLSTFINISPPLQTGDMLKFKMKESLPKGLYGIGLSSKALKKRTDPFDYAGWTISRPSKKLTLNVHFPEFYRPSIFDAAVRYTATSLFPSKLTQQEEQKRLKPQMIMELSGKNFTYNLEVDYPMTGLIYILRWEPVPTSS